MKEKTLEKKIKKATLKKDYEKARFILFNCYIRHFKRMLKYKRVKIDKSWYMHDYLEKIKEAYTNMYSNDINEMMEILYSNKHDVKSQIVWLIENAYIFNDYKL